MGLVIAVMVGAVLYLRFFYVSNTSIKNPIAAKSTVSDINLSNNSASDKSMEDRVKILEDSVTLIARYVGTNNSKATLTPAPANLESKVTALENSLSALQKQVASIQTQVTDLKNTPASTTTSKMPLFIPLGSGGNFNDKGWYTMSGYRVEINSGDYSGYTSMQLEVSMKMNQVIGNAQARLYNLTDNSAVSSSNVSMSSDATTYLYSSGFQIASGKKTYVLQVLSSENIETQIYSARIKVNF